MRSIYFYLRIKTYLFYQEILVIKKYYKKISFAFLDILFKILYSFLNPYRIGRKYQQRAYQKTIYNYGETPIVLFDQLMQKSHLSSKDIFYELGSGRGRLCLFAHQFYECKVYAIEQVSIFINILKFLKKIFCLSHLHILQKDMLTYDFSDATFIYLYGTCLKDEEISKLLKQFLKLKKGAKILTISFPLTAYDSKHFFLCQTFSVKFPWGKTDAYLQCKV